MIRMEPNVVLRYFEPLDTFIKLRHFDPAAISRILRIENIPNRKAYVDLILNLCVVEYHSKIFAPAAKDPGHEVFNELYELCIRVNPSLDINKISIAVEPEPESDSIHLLEERTESGQAEDLRMLGRLEALLERKVIGQTDAIDSVARAVKRSMTGLRDPERPIGSFFFVGQTGVGKTELAKALTEVLFRDRSRLIRIDCSEFALPHEYAKLLGAPPGYVGYESGGVLTSQMTPGQDYVVLFDEFEKADGKLHDLLLQVLDEGFATDAHGQRVPFDRAIVIFTSNLGVNEIQERTNRSGFDFASERNLSLEDRRHETISSLRDFFKPEFLNRVDEVVMFRELNLEHCEEIARNILNEVIEHARNAHLEMTYSSKVPRFLAERGYAPEFGAREIRRTVEYELEAPLSEELIRGRIQRGDRVRADVCDNRIIFHRN